MIVGGFILQTCKLFDVMGKILAYLTFDKVYQQRRQYKIKQNVRNLSRGIVLAFQILFFAFLYMFTQFYYVTVTFHKKYRNYGIFFTILVVK
jgi:hypothetical protein